MEKLTPHYKLIIIKTMIEEGKVSSTMSALVGGAALGFSFMEIVKIVKKITMADFYKSMTTHANHRVWQDVYRRTPQKIN